MSEAEGATDDLPEVLTAQQVCQYLQISRDTLQRLLKEKRIPAVRLGVQWRFPKAQLDQWLAYQARERMFSKR